MEIDWVDLTMGLAGGLALFLLGMGQVTDSLKALGDDRLRSALARLSSNRVLGAATGGGVTAIVQSSSVTTVLTVGFVSAGMLSLTQSAGVIIGANLGTTVTAQVIALDITEYSLGLFAAGALLAAAARRNQLRHAGRAIAGVGLVFLGMETMSNAMAPLGSYQPFLDLVSDTSNPLVALLLGAVFTGLIQSSSATTGIVVVMAAEGLLDLEMGIAIVLGANIGTCITAVLAAIGKGTEAVRTAAVHVSVNTIGAFVWVFFIGDLANLVTRVSPELDATPRQLANAHTVFNLANTVVFLAFLGPLVALIRRVVPDRVGASPPRFETAFLDDDVLDTPVLALEKSRLELMRLGASVRELLLDAVPAAVSGRRVALDALTERDAEVDELHHQIIRYLGEISKGPIGDGQRTELIALLNVANLFEQLADTIEQDVVGNGYQRLERVVTVSPETVTRLDELHEAALRTLDLALEALGEPSAEASRRVTKMKGQFRGLEQATADHLARRLASGAPARIETYSLEVELVNALRYVHDGCRRIARALRPVDNGEAT